jgi:hypothetical protein
MLADGLFRLARQSNGIQLFLRYQAQVERLYRRTVEEFERLKKLRPELPNEPISAEDPPGRTPRKHTRSPVSLASAKRTHSRPGTDESVPRHRRRPWVGQALPPANNHFVPRGSPPWWRPRSCRQRRVMPLHTQNCQPARNCRNIQ